MRHRLRHTTALLLSLLFVFTVFVVGMASPSSAATLCIDSHYYWAGYQITSGALGGKGYLCVGYNTTTHEAAAELVYNGLGSFDGHMKVQIYASKGGTLEHTWTGKNQTWGTQTFKVDPTGLLLSGGYQNPQYVCNSVYSAYGGSTVYGKICAYLQATGP